jgi:hypothetical protein
MQLNSPYLWSKGKGCKVLVDEMKITHQARSEAVNRALSDFGIEESYGKAAMRFKEHYYFDISSSAASRVTQKIAGEALAYLEDHLSAEDCQSPRFAGAGGEEDGAEVVEKLLVELDGCEIRTAVSHVITESDERTPVYENPVKRKEMKWRDVRLGFASPLDSDLKIFAGKMDGYPEVVKQLHGAASLCGMTLQTQVIGVADGGIGLSEELKRQFPNMQFILDKSHLKDHFYQTAEALGMAKKEQAGWVNARIKAISNGEVGKIIRELKAQFNQTPNQRLDRLIGYLERFMDALDYNSFKQKGYPIGSGEIESAHKSIPQKRLKIPGASWHPDSINPILALRIIRANYWWENFWEKRTEKLLAA